MDAQLQPVAPKIWIYAGSEVIFYGFPFPTRMTVVQLDNGDLWIHSPEQLNDGLQQELSALGEVKHLVSPNKLHHLFLDQWIAAYPDAMTYAAPGLSKKRRDIRFDEELSDQAPSAWFAEIDQLVFRGSPVMEELVFFHRVSRTLILTDLIENFDPDSLNWWQRPLAAFAGILYPNGSTPIDWRLSFRFGSRVKARASLARMRAWQPDNIVLSHGECIIGGGSEFLGRSFSWL